MVGKKISIPPKSRTSHHHTQMIKLGQITPTCRASVCQLHCGGRLVEDCQGRCITGPCGKFLPYSLGQKNLLQPTLAGRLPHLSTGPVSLATSGPGIRGGTRTLFLHSLVSREDDQRCFYFYLFLLVLLLLWRCYGRLMRGFRQNLPENTCLSN